VHAGEAGMGGGDGTIGEDDVLKFVVAGREDGSALIYLGRVQEIKDGEMLDRENAVHAFEAQATLAIQEVRDVSLLETGLLGQAKAGKITFLNAFPESIAKILLQNTEFHGWSIARGIALC
jgi:hypothetical protein